jgi:catechol 2,3-dioxygenase-like lactoylglutathione lyase family enzyme
MFSHIMIGTSDFDRAKAFYDTVLATLGAGSGDDQRRRHRPQARLLDAQWRDVLDQRADQRSARDLRQRLDHRLCLRFSLEQVQAFHDAAVAAGGKSIEDPPGPRVGRWAR